ncbi:MAG TPA: M14 family metallopeptidase [Bdellovibrionales bacterium]|nr:M14 family metallopeptidase [Bdellovibrionales bacterium]
MAKGFAVFLGLLFSVSAFAHNDGENLYWLKARAKDKYDRTRIADAGISIEIVSDDYVVTMGDENDRNSLEKMGLLESSFLANADFLDFPSQDSEFHNYTEMKTVLEELAASNPTLVQLDSIGQSVEGREILHLRISGQLDKADQLPAFALMGGHHAREHVSIDIPIRFAKYLIESYNAGDAEVRRLVDNRDIHIIPVVNPDGAEYDIASGNYRMWRKNRSINGGKYGVDLNRNYGYLWGKGGSSTSPSSDVYMGPAPFSEPETKAIKNFVESHSNITMLLSLHTFGELVLWPLGGTYDDITNARDLSVFQTMGKTMADWNGYSPQKSSDLYVASGDTTDWAYGERGIFAFTFELDPVDMWDGGFYPGQAIIPSVLKKNLKPFMYMMDLSDNPYRALEPNHVAYGLSAPLVD